MRWLPFITLIAAVMGSAAAAAAEPTPTLPPLPEPGPDHPALHQRGYDDPSSMHRSYSQDWTGAFHGVTAEFGLVYGQHSLWQDAALLPELRLLGEVSTPFHVLHVSAGFHARSGGSSDEHLRRMGFVATAYLHPMFAYLIAGRRTGYPRGAFYVMAGGSLDHVDLRARAERFRYPALGWHVGTGFDHHLHRPYDRQSWWFGLQYRFDEMPGTFRHPALERRPMRTHVVSLRLSWRRHGLLGSLGVHPDVP